MRSVAAVILAAGASSRLGQPKQLLRIEGKSLLRRTIVAAVDARCAPVVVVVGNERATLETELAGTRADIVENADWARGVGTSIRAGLRSLLRTGQSIDAVVLLACDQPALDAAVISALVGEQRRSGKPIVASHYANTLGVPALFDASCFEPLLALPDDSGAKPVIQSRAADVAKIDFPEGAIDIDTPADLRHLHR